MGKGFSAIILSALVMVFSGCGQESAPTVISGAANYGGKEKTACFPSDITQKDASKGYMRSAGDICIYVPWENLAVCCGYPTLIPMGRIDTGLAESTQQVGDTCH